MPPHLRRRTLAKAGAAHEDSKKEVAPKEVKKVPKEKEPVPLNKKAQKKKMI